MVGILSAGRLLGSSAGFSAFSPLSLFAAGEPGAWYDPSDFSTLFQDSAGTVPVTAIDQPVGRILDKSGRGNHASQSTDASRPVLKQDNSGYYFLLFDGSDDSLATGSINFSATNKMSVCAGVRKLSDAASGIVSELSANFSSNNGSYAMFAPSGAAPNYAVSSRGSLGVSTSIAGYAAAVTSVVTMLADIPGDSLIIRVNGAQKAQSTSDQGTGNYGTHILYLGRRGGSSLPFNGRLYGKIVRGASCSAAELSAMESWMNARTGAY